MWEILNMSVPTGGLEYDRRPRGSYRLHNHFFTYRYGGTSMTIYTKLMQARLFLQATKLNKSGHNKFAGYKYFELGDFLPTVQEIFHNLGLCGVVSYTDDIATLTIVDTEDGSQIEITSPMGSAALKGCHEVQNIGAVETYQRRYLWVTAMEIVEHDVLDATNGQDTPAKRLDKLPQLLEAINTATTESELKLFYAQAYRAAKDVEDTDAMQTIVAAKNARKIAMEAA